MAPGRLAVSAQRCHTARRVRKVIFNESATVQVRAPFSTVFTAGPSSERTANVHVYFSQHSRGVLSRSFRAHAFTFHEREQWDCPLAVPGEREQGLFCRLGERSLSRPLVSGWVALDLSKRAEGHSCFGSPDP